MYGKLSHFLKLTISQFIVIEYQRSQNVNSFAPTVCLQTVASVYIDSTEIRSKLFISPGTALPVQPSQAVVVGTIYHTRIPWLETLSRSALFDILGWSIRNIQEWEIQANYEL